MKKLKLIKAIASSLIVVSVLTLNSIAASAEWKQDSNGWWNAEGNSWSVGWKNIDNDWYYFDNNGYMKTGWIQDGSKWYYLNSSGAMAKSTTIDGYVLDSNGAWIQSTENSSSQNSSSNVDYKAKKISDVTGINPDDITKIIFYDGRGGLNKPVTVEDKQKVKEFMGYLDGYIIKKAKNPGQSTGWIHNAHFYINDKDVMSITFGDPIIINNNEYDVIKGTLDIDDIETIGKFLKSIDSSYDIMAGF